MSREAATLVDEVKQDSAEKVDPSALRSSARNVPQSSSANASGKRNFGDRIKGFFANVAKALEGDHDTHNFRS